MCNRDRSQHELVGAEVTRSLRPRHCKSGRALDVTMFGNRRKPGLPENRTLATLGIDYIKMHNRYRDTDRQSWSPRARVQGNPIHSRIDKKKALGKRLFPVPVSLSSSPSLSFHYFQLQLPRERF